VRVVDVGRRRALEITSHDEFVVVVGIPIQGTRMIVGL